MLKVESFHIFLVFLETNFKEVKMIQKNFKIYFS